MRIDSEGRIYCACTFTLRSKVRVHVCPLRGVVSLCMLIHSAEGSAREFHRDDSLCMHVNSMEYSDSVCLSTPQRGFILYAYSLRGVVLLYLLIHSAGSAHQFHRDDSLCMHAHSAEYNDSVCMSTPRSGCILYVYSLRGLVLLCVLIHSMEWFYCICSSIPRGVHINSTEMIHCACMFSPRSTMIMYICPLRGVVVFCMLIHSAELLYCVCLFTPWSGLIVFAHPFRGGECT